MDPTDPALGPTADPLIDGARAGDPAALGAILERERARLRRLVAGQLDRRLGPRVDASDVVQEVLAAAAPGLPAYLHAPPLPLFPWLAQFARQRVAKAHRHHVRAARRSVAREHPAADPGSGPGEPTDGGTSPSGHLDRELLAMRHVEGLPVARIAARLGITPGAAKVRHLRALRRLRALLESPR